jgi:F0F1-type ATP synthase gamma subunit
MKNMLFKIIYDRFFNILTQIPKFQKVKELKRQENKKNF